MAGKPFAGGKRERTLEYGIDDNFDIHSGRGGATADDDMSSLDKRIKRLDRRNAASEPKMFAKPLWQYSAAKRQAYYSLVGAVAQAVEEQIIRPEDPSIVNDLRRREAAMHGFTSSTSISLYKSRTPNVRYASDGPLKWLQQPGGAESHTAPSIADNWSKSSLVPAHTHSKDDVLVFDIRFVCCAELLGDVPKHCLRDVLFPYYMIPDEEKAILQRMSHHNTFVRFADEFARHEMRGTIDDVMKRSAGMSFFAIRFLYDNRIQIVYNLDVDGVYHGVLMFVMQNAARRNMTPDQVRLVRDSVVAEITKERDADAARAREPSASITALVKDTDVIDEMERMRQLTDTYFKAYKDVAGSVSGTKVDRLLARSCPLAVFHPEKSSVLLATLVKYEYTYFTVCQCALDIANLEVYKQTYARVNARMPFMPKYDSDNEDDGAGDGERGR